MKPTSLSLLSLLAAGASALWADDYTAWRTTHSNWMPVLYDDFTSDSLNTDVWQRIPYINSPSGVSDWRKFQSTDPSLVQQSNGNLTLWGRYGEYTNQTNQTLTTQYACGGVQTINTFSFQYGYVEIRAKFNHTWGVWPALWLMPKNAGTWPTMGEIDMMEHLNNDTYVYQTIHYSENGSHVSQTKKVSLGSGTGDELKDQWHTYGLLWEEGSIKFLMDGNITSTYVTGASLPFDNTNNEFYLILDQQIGGNWVQGAATNNGYNLNNGINLQALTNSGSAMTIDYVHVYSSAEYFTYIPEPATSALSLLSLTALAFRRRRK